MAGVTELGVNIYSDLHIYQFRNITELTDLTLKFRNEFRNYYGTGKTPSELAFQAEKCPVP